ncbi:hypothetical protein LOTGIDRAFT_154774 [Lottia gigantea]|uniref:SMB domain-containing protein n=1 Tax=Lottia gigantea TaxID=225164 RepID=V3ZXC5_LOTGI|nr:hypothetical protein LOTGIDRAFT_154774 [Lottia gigantea]ESO87275.1 hypothetical protein LOTGIDRAFT_154774 [Lottia gigantea]
MGDLHYMVCVVVVFHCIYGTQSVDTYSNQTYNAAYLTFCGQSCISKTVIRNDWCSKCYCDGDCHLYKNCCPDKKATDVEPKYMAYEYTCTTISFPELSKRTNLNTDLCSKYYKTCDNLEFEVHPEAFFLIKSCPNSFTGSQEVVTRCENIIDMEDQSTIHPITNWLTQLSYRNIYCASCNGVQETERWEMWLICRDVLPDRFGNNVNDLYHNFRTTEGCSIHFEPTNWQRQRTCHSGKKLINSCNVTGLWSGDEPDLPSKCNQTYQYENPVFGYQNMFCYLCNIPDSPDTLEDIVGVVDDNLSHLQPADYSVVDIDKKVCRPISCPDGRRLVNGICRSLFHRFNGYKYKICLKYEIMVSNATFPDSRRLVFKFISKIQHLVFWHGIYTVQNSLALLGMTPCLNGYLNATVVIGLHLTSRRSQGSEDENIRLIQDNIVTIVGSEKTAPFNILSVEQLADCVVRDRIPKNSGGLCLKYKSSIRPRPLRHVLAIGYIYLAKEVMFSKLLTCPQMVLEQNETVHDLHNGVITILANQKNLTSIDFRLVNGTYLICVEDYLQNAEIVETETCTHSFDYRPVIAESTSRVSGLNGSFYVCLLLFTVANIKV